MNEIGADSVQSNMEKPSVHIYQLPGFWPVVVFALTLLTHGYYIAEMADHPFFNYPLVDSKTYHQQAEDIRQHGWLGREAFWQAPLYPYFLAFCYHFITVKFFDIRVIQAVLAAISAVLLYRIGRRKVGAGVAVGAAMACAFYGPLVFFNVEMLAPVLIVLFYMLMALALDRAFGGGTDCQSVPPGRDARATRAKLVWWPVAGVLNGLAALAHGLGLLIAPLVCIYGLFGRPMRSVPWGLRSLAVVLFLVGTAIPIVPVTARNYIVSKQWVLISYNGPINLFIGNHPKYDEMVGLRPGLEWGSLTRSLDELGIGRTIGDSTRYFMRGFWANLRQHPAAVARVWLKKVFLFFNADEIKRNYPIYPMRDNSRLLWALLWKWPGPGGWIGFGFPFGLVLPLAVAGWWDLRRRGIRLIAVEAIMAGHLLANLVFFICSRYRVPLAPFFLLYAAAGVRWLLVERMWQARALRQHWRPLAAMLAIFLFSNARLKPMDNREDLAEYEFNLGYVSHQTGEYPEALESYLAALEDNPNFTEAHFFLGILYQDHLSEPRRALEQFDWVLARDPGNMTVMYNKAISLDSLGARSAALQILRTLVENDPDNKDYRAYLEQLSGKATPPQSKSQTEKQPKRLDPRTSP